MSPIIVVTDLDGTLLDHDDYGLEPARPALAELRRRRIPLVFNSSKTAAEIARWRQLLDNAEPYVVENGGGIHWPDGRQTVLGKPRAEILAAAGRLRAREGYRYTGFADLDGQALARITGLAPAEADLALRRDYTEPLLWEDSAPRLERFLAELAGAGITALRGGRFLHLGGGGDKGAALAPLRRHYAALLGETPRIIALGDSDNDLPMLLAADRAVLVRSPVRSPALDRPDLIRTLEPGPAGWNQAVLTLLKRLDAAGHE